VSASVSASGGVNAGNWSQSGGFQANTNFLADQWKADFVSGKAQEDAAAQEASRAAQNRNNSESGKSVLDGAAISTQRREENILDHVLNKAGDALGGALDWVGNKIDGAIDSVVGAASSAWDGVKNFASSAVESIGSATLGLGKVNISTNPLDYISGNGFKAESGGGFFGGLKGKLGNIGEGISGFFSGDSKSDSNSVTNRDGNQTQDTTRNYTVEGAALKLQLESGQIQPAEYNKKVAELNKAASTDTAYLTKRGEKIVQIAEGYLDKGFTYAVNGKNSLENKTLDCTGFTHTVYSQYGIDLGASIKGTSGIENDTKNFTKVKESQRLPGDIFISTAYDSNKKPMLGHAYMYTGKTGSQEFIQSSPSGLNYTNHYLPGFYKEDFPDGDIRSGYYRPKPTNLEMVKE
ncbi:NlpC/P60 family protein, partial [Leptospira santarosai]